MADSYVIKRDGLYVAQKGSQHSYTNKLQNAQVYRSLEEARKQACENETVVLVSGEVPQ